MKIRKLQLKNIGVFDDETIEFPPCPTKNKAEIHILTGQNGSGKSTILLALASIFNPDFAHTNDESSFSSPLFKRFRHYSERKFDGFVEIAKSLKDFPDAIVCTFDNNKKNIVKVYKDKANNMFATQSATKEYGEILRGKEGRLDFVVFAFSGYRQLKTENVEAIKESKNFNPLSQSLDFIKDYSQINQLTINQLIANNISKSAIEINRNKKKSEKFAKVVSSIEKIINEITGWEIEFDLHTEPTNLVVKINERELDLDVLPDGLRSLISWIADLLGRIDLLKWNDDLPIFEKNLILFLDEIEVHLHPAWQRKVLPVVQKLFKNSQIFISTHSPFVINSVDDAWIYKLELEKGKATVSEPIKSKDAYSYQTVLREIFGIDKRFGGEAQKDLDKFYEQRDAILKANGNGKVSKKKFLTLAKNLARQSSELQSIVILELFQLSRQTGENFEL
jgi:predicted ATP-binding protein involved in virulence